MTPSQASKAGLRAIWRPRAHIASSPLCLMRRPASTLLNRAVPHLPRILQPSMWETIIPTSIRSNVKELFSQKEKKPTNPATFFIWIYILIGSQAIRILQTKNDHASYSRRADLQIEKLREVVRKLQAGEEVDVEKVLGTGVPEEEEAWEEALKEIEREERVWRESKSQKRERRRQEKAQAEKEAQEREDASPINSTTEEATSKQQGAESAISSSQPPFSRPTFY